MKKKTRNLCLLLCTMLLLVTIAGCGSDKKEAIKENAITVDMAEAVLMDISKSVDYAGTVKASNEVSVMPKVASRVTASHVEPGDHVNQGQLLLSLDRSDLEVSIKQAEASLAAAQANQRTNEINLEAARRNYERMQNLYDAGAIAEKDMEIARNQYESLKSGTVEASVAQAEAALIGLQKQMEYCNITSPIDGVVGRIDISPGEITNPQQPAVVVNNSDQLEVEIMVNEKDASHIIPDSEADILIEAVSSEKITGRIKSVSTIADPLSRNYAVKITLPNTEGKIKSGMFAQASVTTLSKEDVLCIPLAAVMPNDETNVVYTIDAENRAHKLEVKTGITDGSYIEIIDGLNSGQKVVTRGNTLINEGTLLRITGGGDK